jgi:hypothetical protein
LNEAPTNHFNDTPQISHDDIESARRRRIRVTEMADRLLAYCANHSETLSQVYWLNDRRLLKPCFAFGSAELHSLVQHLVELGFMRNGPGLDSFFVTPVGYGYVEERGSRVGDSNQAVVAMWFAPDMNDAFQGGFDIAIQECGYAPLRIDRKEHNQKIDDEIIAEIRRSKFVVADFTGHRGGVYFEAGFALGIGLPIIWTCRKDHISELHFDIRQYNCIDWSSADDLRIRLSNRIVALLGSGPLKS